MIEEANIASRWEAIPVGENVVGSLWRDFGGDYAAFFDAYDKWLYSTQGHILQALDRFVWAGKRVLEIGLGQGADSEQLIRRGAIWSGIDLTWESVDRVRNRFKFRGIPYDALVQGTATSLPFREHQFDVVYSHGALHHVPDIGKAQKEIHRVLKVDGRLILMVYARNSLNYQLSIRWIRRAGLALICALPVPVRGIYAEHKKLARQTGVYEYLKLKNFIHRSTDGPYNQYSKVYDRPTLLEDFSCFDILNTFKFWMHAPPLPVHRLPGEAFLGWHLWAELRPKDNC